MRTGLALLRTRNFSLLFFGRVVSVLGNAMAPVALAFAVLDLTGSASALGIVIAARTAANAIFLAIGGVIADRLPRRAVLIGSNLIAGSSQAIAAVLLISGGAEVWQLVVLEAINGAAAALFYPADIATVPLTVSDDRLQEANAILGLGTNSVSIAGAAVAGVLVATINPGWTIAVDASTFFIAAGLTVGMRLAHVGLQAGTSFLTDLRDGWSEFTAHRWLWAIVLQFSVMLVGYFGAFMVLGPVVSVRDLSGPSSWAAILGGQSAGLVVGGFISLRWRPSRPMFIATLAVFGNALPIAALALGLPLPVIVAASIINGIDMEIFGVLWYTALHENVAPEALSRVSAYDALGSICVSPLGLIAAGPVSDRLGIDATLWLGASLIIVPTALVLLVPEVRGLRSRSLTPGPSPFTDGEGIIAGNDSSGH